MTHDDASVETGVGGQAKYDVMMVFCGNALQKHHKTLKTSSSRYSDCHMSHTTHFLYTSYVVKIYRDDCFQPKRKYIQRSLTFLGMIVHILCYR